MADQPNTPVDLDALSDAEAVELLNTNLADPAQQAPDPEPVHQTPELDIHHPDETQED